MRVKIFDENHEKDLELKVNEFIKKLNPDQLIDIKYQLAVLYDEREQIYCFSCMVIYHEDKTLLERTPKKSF